jgi:hypothetical protein
MSISGSALAALIQSNVDSRMALIQGYHPLQQKNPFYYIQFAQAIGNGIVSGGPTISFTTNDTGSSGAPLIAGTGAGIGIVTDPTFFVQDLYTRVRDYVLQDFGQTLHSPYPPEPGNSGQYLLALCEGINDSFLSYFPTAWTLVSSDPQIYQGTGIINVGQFSGLSATAIQSSIVSDAPSLMGKFWPRIARAIAESYVALIEQHSTGTVTITGTCTTSDHQVCGIPSTGTGSGTAS